jgi:hypothetical protein
MIICSASVVQPSSSLVARSALAAKRLHQAGAWYYNLNYQYTLN